MKTSSAALEIVAATLLVTGLSSTALADRTELKFEKEIDSCVAAVSQKIDLTNANRVRHVVTQSDRSGIGYALTIQTSVFSSGAERRYEAYCVASGTGEPVKFRIDEQEI